MLSITVITGIGGTISLCQATFAAIGGVHHRAARRQVACRSLLAIVLGALVAAAVGALLALPVLRLGGIYLGAGHPGVRPDVRERDRAARLGSAAAPLPLTVPRPLIGPIDFADDRTFFLLCVVCLAVVGLLVLPRPPRHHRAGSSTRCRGSESPRRRSASAPTRRSHRRLRLSAGIAGFGGGLLASYDGQANYDQNFTFFFGLVWVVLVVTAGVPVGAGRRHVRARLLPRPRVPARLFDMASATTLTTTPTCPASSTACSTCIKPEWALGVAFILFGFGALTYAKHPEGIIEHQTSASIGA